MRCCQKIWIRLCAAQHAIDNRLYLTSGIEKGVDLRRSCFVEHDLLLGGNGIKLNCLKIRDSGKYFNRRKMQRVGRKYVIYAGHLGVLW